MAKRPNRPNEVKNKKPKKKKKIFLGRMRGRLTFVVSLFGLATLAPITKIIVVNASDGKRYEQRVLKQRNYDSLVVPYKRGDIVDRNGTILATSRKEYSLVIEPFNILKDETKKSATVAALKQFFNLTDEEISEALSHSDSLYRVIKRKLTYTEIKEFQDYQKSSDGKNVVGVWFEEGYDRVYPNNEVACHLIGFTVSGNEGLGGIEGRYNKYLNGQEGRKYTYLTDDFNTQKVTEPATNGNNLTTTIDVKVQEIVQENAEAYISEVGASNISVIVMDPNTCEVLALYNSHQYDPNNAYSLESIKYQFPELSDIEFEQKCHTMSDDDKVNALNKVWRSFAVSDTFEPGSTFKTFTIAGALEENVISENDTFYCDGNQQVLNRKINCHRRTGHGPLSVSEALQKSCNDSLMQIAAKEGPKIFDKYQRIFGFGQRAGIDISGEMSDADLSFLVFHEDTLRPTELATSSFGQGVSVTMIQLSTAFCSVINGGYYYQPHVVKQISDENGNIVKSYGNILVRRTISEETSNKMRKMLFEVVESGTGKKAAVEGYAIGGKTGTAEKKGRDKKNYVLSFIGFAPYDNPQVVIYCVVDEPNVDDQSASGAGCILFKRIAEELFPYLNIYKTNDNYQIDWSDVEDEIPTPVFDTTEPAATETTEAAPAEGTDQTGNVEGQATPDGEETAPEAEETAPEAAAE